MNTFRKVATSAALAVVASAAVRVSAFMRAKDGKWAIVTNWVAAN